MSLFLYRLGRLIVRRRKLVVTGWLVALAVIGGCAALFNQGTEDTFEIPGAESQDTMTHLKHVFPQVSGAQSQVVAAVPDGQRIDSPEHQQAISSAVDRFNDVEQVTAAMDPFDENTHDAIASDGRAVMIMVQVDADIANVAPETKTDLLNITHSLQERLGPGSEAHAGGDIFAINVPTLSVIEAIGVLVALLVLMLMFRSAVAASMPLVTALVGVGVSMGAAMLTTVIAPMSSTAPLLAIMLGLAVGIDYALFILSRHRDQLADGVSAPESIARAVATAGSAVIFAGLTVVIALLALAVPGLPFLTAMGQVAAGAVVCAVLVAITFIPALLGFAGERLRPKQRRRERKRPQRAAARKPLSLRWVRMVTKAPLITILVVVAGLGICALPATNLQLALPDNGTQEPGTPAREAYDTVTEHFGAGYNAPLVVTADIIGSDDPLGVVNGIADEIRQLDGVAAVPMSTPNQTIDTGIVQVFPKEGGDSPQTTELVQQLRGMNDHFQEKYGSETAVTGMVAITIDLSTNLADSLLPFGAIVVGLSLILLAIMFRSIWVPIKAAIGYLLSVGATFGATTFVFGEGHFAEALNVTHVGSVISFLPIILMGVLFGLAMDYEVFLVSRMHEEYVRTRSPKQAIEAGFVSVARVVVSAAVIMFAVFAAFVPEGDAKIKPIAFGLALGVFIDAFIVRMALVPAVLALLGHRAWKIPAWLDRKLPSFDVEGSALVRERQLAERVGEDSTTLIWAQGLRLRDDRDRELVPAVDLDVAAGDVLGVYGGTSEARSALLLALGGRVSQVDGDVQVLGQLLPQRGRAVRKRVAFVPCQDIAAPDAEIRSALDEGITLILLDNLDAIVDGVTRAAVRDLISDASTRDGHPVGFVFTCQDPSLVDDVVSPWRRTIRSLSPGATNQPVPVA